MKWCLKGEHGIVLGSPPPPHAPILPTPLSSPPLDLKTQKKSTGLVPAKDAEDSSPPLAGALLWRNVLSECFSRHKGRAVIVPPLVPLSLCSPAIGRPTPPQPNTEPVLPPLFLLSPLSTPVHDPSNPLSVLPLSFSSLPSLPPLCLLSLLLARVRLELEPHCGFQIHNWWCVYVCVCLPVSVPWTPLDSQRSVGRRSTVGRYPQC